MQKNPAITHPVLSRNGEEKDLYNNLHAATHHACTRYGQSDFLEALREVANLVGISLPYTEHDHAKLRGLLYLYEDCITLEHTGVNQPAEYIVAPADLAAALSGVPRSSGLLPPNCLFHSETNGKQRLGVYVEPQVWTVSVEGKRETWRVPMPPLVFVGHGTDYNLYALKEAKWPGLDARLYHAPCPNVWGSQGVCQGNAPFPVASSETIWRAVEIFFSSGFNTHLSNGKSKAHKNNILRQWQALWQAKATVYPATDLVDSGLRLKQIAGGER